MVVDPDYDLSTRCLDEPQRTPFSVPFDPSGRVRLIQDSYYSDCNGDDVLLDDVENLVWRRPIDPSKARTDQPLFGRPVPSITLTARGRPVSLRALSAERPVLLVSPATDVGFVPRLTRLLPPNPPVTMVIVETSKIPLLPKEVPGRFNVIVVDDEAEIGALRVGLQLGTKPACLLIARGTFAFASGPRADYRELVRMINDGPEAVLNPATRQPVNHGIQSDKKEASDDETI